MEWVSNARYNQDVMSGSVFEAKKIGRRVAIHRIHGYGDNWYLTCRDLGIEKQPLETEHFQLANSKAKEIIRSKLFALNQIFKDFWEDTTETTFTRY